MYRVNEARVETTKLLRRLSSNKIVFPPVTPHSTNDGEYSNTNFGDFPANNDIDNSVGNILHRMKSNDEYSEELGTDDEYPNNNNNNSNNNNETKNEDEIGYIYGSGDENDTDSDTNSNIILKQPELQIIGTNHEYSVNNNNALGGTININNNENSKSVEYLQIQPTQINFYNNNNNFDDYSENKPLNG